MSADEKEEYFDGPHMSSLGPQPACSSTDQRQGASLHYNSVSQVHNHVVNPTSIPFFYNPNQFNPQQDNNPSWQPNLEQVHTEAAQLNGEPTGHQFENQSSVSSSQQSSPEKSNFYANMVPSTSAIPSQPQQAQIYSENNDQPGLSNPPPDVTMFQPQPIEMIQPQPNENTSLQSSIVTTSQYMLPQEQLPPFGEPTPVNIQEHYEVGNPQNQTFGSYMNMANNPETNTQQQQLQQQQQQLQEQQQHFVIVPHPLQHSEVDLIPNEDNLDQEPPQPSEPSLPRQQNFSSNHLHRSYASNVHREYDDILHSQGTWPGGSIQHTEVLQTENLALIPVQADQMADDPVEVDLQEEYQPQADQDPNHFEAKEISDQIETLNLAAPESEDLNVDEVVQIGPGGTIAFEVKTDPNQSEPSEQVESKTVEVEEPESDGEKNLAVVEKKADGFVNVPQPNKAEPFQDPSSSSLPSETNLPTMEPIVMKQNPLTSQEDPITSEATLNPPIMTPFEVDTPSTVTSQSNDVVTIQTVSMRATPPSGDADAVTRNRRKPSVESLSSQRSGGSLQSRQVEVRPQVEVPPNNPPPLTDDTNMMHSSSYVSIQHKQQAPTTSAPPAPSPPLGVSTDRNQPAPPEPSSAPNSLHSQMVTKRTQQLPQVVGTSSQHLQQSYNDMHASSHQGSGNHGNQQSHQSRQHASHAFDANDTLPKVVASAASTSQHQTSQVENNLQKDPQTQPESLPYQDDNYNQSSYSQSHRYHAESYDRAPPPRPHSRSSATAADNYHNYRSDRYDLDDRGASYNRPHSRQGYATDRNYSRHRYPNEYDDYYDRRMVSRDDYYNNYHRHGYRDYQYQGYGDYYQRHGGYEDYYRRDNYYQAQDGNYYRRSDYNNGRSQDNWNYKSDPYQQDYQQQQSYRRRQPDDEDHRSVYSERSMHYDDTINRSAAIHQQEQYQDSYNDQQRTQYYTEDLTFNSYTEDQWQPLPQVPQRRTPAKFSVAHPVARFGAGGHLVHVLPHLPTENQAAVVKIHNLEILLQDSPNAESFRSYPGPLSKEETHKNDVLRFVTSQSAHCMQSTDLMDRTSTALMWDFLGLLVRQNGSILGTDVAELLMKDHSGDFGLLHSPNETQAQQQKQLNNASADDDETVVTTDRSQISSVASTSGATCPSMRFRELLLYGRKKDALEWAMKSDLWGHALLLASKTDARTHANVMLRFANSLSINDPLQTLYQQMSGRQPAAATCLADEGWGDWRPHLAMILSNATNNVTHDAKIAMTMGDSLAAKGLLDAAHFCFLMASAPLGYYTRKTNKLVLLGSNQNLPFDEFSNNESIRRSETYEYAISLGTHARHKGSLLPSLQIYKFIYACRLMECGMVEKAFHYCEMIAKLICRSPKSYSVTLVNQLSNIVGMLQHHDRRLQAGTLHSTDLQWIANLVSINEQMQTGGIVPLYTTTPSISATTDEPTTSSSRSTPGQQIESPRTEDDGEPPQPDPNHPYLQPNYNREIPYQPQQQDSQQPPTFYQQPTPGMTSQPPPMMMSQPPPMMTSQQPMMMSQPPPMMTSQPPLQGQLQPEVMQQSNPLSNMEIPPQAPGPQYNAPHSGAPPSVEPVVDYYDQFASVRASSRIRTTSQNSHASVHSRSSAHRQRLDSKRSRSSGRRSRTVSENSRQSRSRSASAESDKQGKNKQQQKDKKGSWFFGLFGAKKKENSHNVHLPDDSKKDIIWDEEKKKWINVNEPEEEQKPLAPPPIDPSSESAPLLSTGEPQVGAPGLTPNKFSLKNMSGRPMYKNAFGSNTTSLDGAVAPQELFPKVAQQSNAPPAMFIPKPVPTSAPQDVSTVQSHDHNLNQQNQQQEQQNFQQQEISQQNFQQQQNFHQQQQNFQQQQEIPQQQNFQQQQQPQFFQPQQTINQPIFNPQQQQQQEQTDPIAPHQHGQQQKQIFQNQSSNPTQEAPPQQASTAPPVATFYNPANFASGVNALTQPGAPQGGMGARRGRGRPAYPSVR